MSKESAGQLVAQYIKKQKKTDRVNVAKIEEKSDGYIVRGITPVVLEGTNWAERFTVHVDNKGKVKSTDYALI
jgi:hypothetical protein